MDVKIQRPIEEYSEGDPYRLLYVSTIDEYKHQNCVVEAVHHLREIGIPVKLDLVGSAYPPSLKRLKNIISKFDKHNKWVNYLGAVAYERLHDLYARADLGVLHQVVAHMPIILLENGVWITNCLFKKGPYARVAG